MTVIRLDVFNDDMKTKHPVHVNPNHISSFEENADTYLTVVTMLSGEKYVVDMRQDAFLKCLINALGGMVKAVN